MNEPLSAHITHLIDCISFEMKEQERRFQLEEGQGLKALKAMGVALHPINVTRKSFGYADYPEIHFKLPFVGDTSSFKENSAIECFVEGEEAVKGIFLGMDGMKGSFRLFAPDFPDWIEERGVGIKLAPDHYTSDAMVKGLKAIPTQPAIHRLFQQIHGELPFDDYHAELASLSFYNQELNVSQQNASTKIAELANQESGNLLIIHGPPGTGKTTTLVEGIRQLVGNGKRLLVTAPSNAAVDNIAKKLVEAGVHILRVGNSLKVDDAIYPYTSEGKMEASKEQKEIKKLKIRAEEFRRMAHQYKRNFGREEREQRNLLIAEVKRLRKEIRALRTYFDEKLMEQAEVVLSTPIGLLNGLPTNAEFDALIMDEAGQAIEPLAWLIFPFAKSWVLAGDPFQLPPTVLSSDAMKAGFNRSILEVAFDKCPNVYLLDTQYRMRKSIAEFSSRYFYECKLITPENQADEEEHILFYDTAGTGFEEKSGEDGTSLVNEGEMQIISTLLERLSVNTLKAAFISPYSGQVQLATSTLSSKLRISTIDSFQGQEADLVIISLVRSNSESNIGFLNDYRRMNVALTRAKQQLIVIGDSSTIGHDPFYASFLEYMEEIGGYRSAWEFL